MGGPGVILSSETLRRGELLFAKKNYYERFHNRIDLIVAPHIPTCLKNLYSTHEDVEVGRCVQKFAGIPCTWNYEVFIMDPVRPVIFPSIFVDISLRCNIS